MRSFGTVATVLTVCGLALAGCGSDDDEQSAATSATTTPTTSTETVPTTTGTVPPTTTTDDSGSAPSTGTTETSTTPTSGGAAPSDDSSDATDATGGATPDGSSGDQPAIRPGTASTPATVTAGDRALAELWCDQARRGSFDEQVGEATSLVITVSGSDDTQRCELPR